MYINSLNEEYYTIIDFNEVDIRIYLPEKSDNSPGPLFLPKLKSIAILLYDFI